jgi:hypothetical protein
MVLRLQTTHLFTLVTCQAGGARGEESLLNHRALLLYRHSMSLMHAIACAILAILYHQLSL